MKLPILIVRRFLFLLLVIWAAATITFFIPRLSDKNPVRERFAQLAMSGGFAPADLEVIVESYNQMFGLDKPLLEQYAVYITSLARFDLGVSMNRYPRTVMQIITDALPWTIGLLLVTTILAFIIGNLLGAISAWPRSPRLAADPFYSLRAADGCAAGVDGDPADIFCRLSPQAAADERLSFHRRGAGSFVGLRAGRRAAPDSACAGAYSRLAGFLGAEYARYGYHHPG